MGEGEIESEKSGSHLVGHQRIADRLGSCVADLILHEIECGECLCEKVSG